MTALADQSLAQMGGRTSVLARQRRDHIELDRLLDRLTQLPASDQGPVLLRIYRLVFPHAFAEESVIWPVIRRVLPEGQELTLKVELEHQAINELVTRLERLDPRSKERQQVLNSVISLLRQDVRDEENELLPRLQSALSTPQLRLLGVAWDAVRRIAPTRAHPIVSRRPPGNVLAALPLSILDRSRDGVDSALHHGLGPADRPFRAFSSALGRASTSVERLPGMRSGEDVATRLAGNSRRPWIAAVVIGAAAASAAVVVMRRRRRRALADAEALTGGPTELAAAQP